MTVSEQNKLSELNNTLSFINNELNKVELELRNKKADISADMQEISQRYCLLVKERFRINSALNKEIAKLLPRLG